MWLCGGTLEVLYQVTCTVLYILYILYVLRMIVPNSEESCTVLLRSRTYSKTTTAEVYFDKRGKDAAWPAGHGTRLAADYFKIFKRHVN